LEEVLKDPQAALSKVDRLLSPSLDESAGTFPRQVIPLHPPTTTGMEELIKQVPISARVLAIELGGTWIRAALVDAKSGDILVSVPDQAIAAPRDPQHVLGLIAQQTQKVLKQASLSREDVGTISVSSPGDLDEATGYVTLQNNLPFTRQNLRELIIQRLGGPVLISNDMTAAVRGEAIYGSGRGRKLAAYLTVSTGTNAAYWTSSGKAVDLGLWGYTAADGQTVEENTSGVHLARRARERLTEPGGDRILQLAGGNPEAITSVHVGQAFQEANPLAVDLVENSARALGQAIGAATLKISVAGDLSDEPEVLWIAGGGVAQGLGQPFVDLIQAHAPPGVKVVLSQMSGSHRGLSGAAARVREAAGMEESERAALPIVTPTVSVAPPISAPAGFPPARILLIPSDVRDRTTQDKDRKHGVFVAPPFGIYRIKRYLENKGVATVDVFDPNLYPDEMHEALEALLEKSGYDIIGFGPTHINMKGDMQLLRFVRTETARLSASKGFRRSLLVGGGSEITENYGQWLENSPMDLALLGYGESVLADVIAVHQTARTGGVERFSDVAGVAYLQGGKPVVRYARGVSSEFFHEVAYRSDPVQDIPYEVYWKHNADLYTGETMRARAATIRTARLFTSSHCPNGCGFCSSQMLLKSATGGPQVAVLRLNAQEIAGLVKKTVDLHGADAIYFNDDDFVIGGEAGRQRIKDFCLLVIDMKARGEIPEKFKFYTQTRARSITVKPQYGAEFVPDMELLDLMKQAGFALVAIGVETFSDRLADQPSIKKRMPSQMAEAALNGLFAAGIIPLVNIILMPPEVTEQDILITADKTLDFVRRGARVSMQPLIEVYPGAPMVTPENLKKLHVRTQTIPAEGDQPELEIFQDVLPTDPRLHEIAEDIQPRSDAILKEFSGSIPNWDFKTPPQPVPGMAYMAAVLRGLGHNDRVEAIRQVAAELAGVYHSYFEHGSDIPSESLLAARRWGYERRSDVVGLLNSLKEKGGQADLGNLVMMFEDRFFYSQELSLWVVQRHGDLILNTMAGIINRYSQVDDFRFDPAVVEFLKRFAQTLAGVAPTPETERLLALLNFHFRIATNVLMGLTLNDGTTVDIRPHEPVLNQPEQLAELFAGKNVVVVEEHHDDAALYMGNIVLRDVRPHAKQTTLVTVTSDPMGVTDSYAKSFRAQRKISDRVPLDVVKKNAREAEGQQAAANIGVDYVQMRVDQPVIEAVHSDDGRFLSYFSRWKPFGQSLHRQAERILEERDADVLIVGLPRVAFHQHHRDVPQLYLNAAHAVNLQRVAMGRPPIQVYFYIGTNPGEDPFAAYGITPNVLSNFGPEGQAKKQAWIATYASQTARRPSYGQEAEARDHLLAQTYLSPRLAAAAPYAEALLAADLVASDGRNLYRAVAENLVSNSLELISERLLSAKTQEPELVRLIPLDNNVLWETPDEAGLLPQRISNELAEQLSRWGVMSIVVGGDGQAAPPSLRGMIEALVQKDPDVFIEAVRKTSGFVRLEVFSQDRHSVPPGVRVISWKETVHRQVAGAPVIMVGVHQEGYHRYLGVLEKIAESDVFVLGHTFQYVRSEWQNRQRFGDAWVTVPLTSGSLSDPIAAKRIAPDRTDWKQQHLDQLKRVLSREPFFQNVEPFLTELYRRDWSSLGALSEAITRYVVKAMGLTNVALIRDVYLGPIEPKLTKGALLAEMVTRATDGVVDPSMQQIVYVSGKGAHYLEEFDAGGIKNIDRLQNAGIHVDYQHFDPEEVRQKWGINPLVSGIEVLSRLGSEQSRAMLAECRERTRETRQRFAAGMEEGFSAYLAELEKIRHTYVVTTGSVTPVQWQLEQLALDYTGHPSLIEETDPLQREESLRARQVLRWIYDEPKTRQDFKRFVETHPVTHTFRNRITPAALVIANYLSGRPLNDREILGILPEESLRGNETLAQHPWFGHDAENLPQAPTLPKPPFSPKKPIRVLVVGAAEKANPANSGLRYLKTILEHAPALQGHPIEITGNDVVFQEEVRSFDGTGRYQGIIPGIQLAADGTYRDEETGIILLKIRERGNEDPLTRDFQPRDAGLYDVVLVSRVAVQFFDEKEKVALLKRNVQSYLNPTGLLLFDDEYADHLELIHAGKKDSEPTTVPYLDNTALERRIDRLPIPPEWKTELIRAHRLAERFADLKHPVVNRFWEAWRYAAQTKDADLKRLVEILTVDVPKQAVLNSSLAAGMEEQGEVTRREFLRILASAVGAAQTSAYKLITAVSGPSADRSMHETIRFLTGVLASRSGVSMEDIARDPGAFLSDYWNAHRSDLEEHGERNAESSLGKHLDSRYGIVGRRFLHNLDWAGRYIEQQVKSLRKKEPEDRNLGNPPYFSLRERASMGTIKDVNEWTEHWSDFLRGELHAREGELKSLGEESASPQAIRLRREVSWLAARKDDLERFAKMMDEDSQLDLLREGYRFWLNRLRLNLKQLQPLVEAKIRQVHLQRLREERKTQDAARRDLQRTIQSIQPRIPPGAVFVVLVPLGDSPRARGVIDDWSLLVKEIKRHPGLQTLTLVREELSPGEDPVQRARAVAERFNLPGRQLTVGIALGVVPKAEAETLYNLWPQPLLSTDPLLALSFIYTPREKISSYLFEERAPVPSYSSLFAAWASDPHPGLMSILPGLTFSQELWNGFEDLVKITSGLEEQLAPLPPVQLPPARQQVLPMRFVVDTYAERDPEVLRFAQWAALLMRAGVPVRFAGVATAWELAQAQKDLPIEDRQTLEDHTQVYNPADPASYEAALAVAKASVFGSADSAQAQESILTRVDPTWVEWFLDELQRLGIQELSSPELLDRIETYLTAA